MRCHLCIKKTRSFYQDRLGTKIGKALEKRHACCVDDQRDALAMAFGGQKVARRFKKMLSPAQARKQREEEEAVEAAIAVSMPAQQAKQAPEHSKQTCKRVSKQASKHASLQACKQASTACKLSKPTYAHTITASKRSKHSKPYLFTQQPVLASQLSTTNTKKVVCKKVSGRAIHLV